MPLTRDDDKQLDDFISFEDFEVLYDKTKGFTSPQNPNHPATEYNAYELMSMGSNAILSKSKNKA